jgi:SAM-dependent methyltransferase
LDRREKEKLYSSYHSSLFRNLHPGDEDEFVRFLAYFKKNYLPHLPSQKNAMILELGCGMGHFLNFLEKEGYQNYLGVDICEENILFCAKRGISATHADIFSFLEDSGKLYDAIVMNDVLEHFDKGEVIQILGLAYKRLSPHGRLLLKVPNAANPIVASSSRYIDFTHELLFTEESISQVLRISGFKSIRIYAQDLYVFSKNPLNYLAKFLNFLLNGIFRLLFKLYGRKTTKIFTKCLIVVAVKDE